MGKIVAFMLDRTTGDVKGDFSADPGDYVLLLASGSTANECPGGVHIKKPNTPGCSCALLGSPCPLTPMAGYSIPENPFAKGDYKLVFVKTDPTSGNLVEPITGNLNVGSRPPTDPGPTLR